MFGCRHVALLQVRGVDFKVQPLKLESVRPFLLDTVALSDGDFQAEDKDEVERFLEHQVELKQLHGTTQRQLFGGRHLLYLALLQVQNLIDRKALEYPSSDLLPLIRLKVCFSPR